MWNQTYNPPKTQYYSYSNKRKQQLAKLSKYKLLILLITRFTHKLMKDSISHIQKIVTQQSSSLDKLWNHMNRSAVNAQAMAIQKLKQNVIISRNKQNKIKNMCVLLQRINKYKLKKTFGSILLFSQRKNQAFINNMDYMRKTIFSRKLQKVFINKKKQYLCRMMKYSNFIKRINKKLVIASIISKQYVKNVKQACFNRLTKFSYNKSNNSNNLNTSFDNPNNKSNIIYSSPYTTSINSYRSTQLPSQNNLIKQQNQKKNLQKKLSDMESQLQTKNASICKLQQQILQLKMEQSSHNYNSFSQYTTNFNNQSIRNRSIANQNKRTQNQSLDSGLDFSLGSILGNSFSLNKSRSKQMRKGDSIASLDCNCSYKQKYIKMKNSNESLKNQLQIVKQQLEVAKDLNDHFTNEIRQYFGGQKDSIQLDRLKKQIKDIQKQREQLRMKITKYQHHITTLKSQFKLKIQELYRKVKKQR